MNQYTFKYTREVIIAVLIIALLSLGYCHHTTNSIPVSIKSDKKDLKKALDGVKIIQDNHKKLVDSLRREDLIKDQKISELRASNIRLETIISTREDQLKNRKKEVSKYSMTQHAAFIADRYNSKTLVSAEENSLRIKDSIPKKIVLELLEKDVLVLNEVSYKKIISLTNDQYKLAEEKLINKNLELASKELEAQALQDGLNKSINLNTKTEAELRRAKRSGALKTFVIVGAGVGGFLLGQKL